MVDVRGRRHALDDPGACRGLALRAVKSDAPYLHTIRLRRADIADWDGYPFSIGAIRTLRDVKVKSRVLFLVGENGSGKSTVLEAVALACGFGPEGGTRNMHFTMRQTREGTVADARMNALADALDIARTKRQSDGFFLRAESFHNVATLLEQLNLNDGGAFNMYGGESLHHRSHGESFLTLFLNRFRAGGLFLLDEPEAALSTARQLAMMVRMHDLLEEHAGTQFIIATHSPILLAYPEAQILSFDSGYVHEIAYRDTDAYVLTRRFLNDPAGMLHRMFTESDDV
jgi:predicted ATPase